MNQILNATDYYAVLGLKETDDLTTADIRHAYLKRSRYCHPDKATDQDLATESFQVLTAAYDTLRDPVRRRQYDLGLLTERQDHYLGPGDVFEQLLLQVLQEASQYQCRTMMALLGKLIFCCSLVMSYCKEETMEWVRNMTSLPQRQFKSLQTQAAKLREMFTSLL
ncbi:hypothetical protein VTP01DRAFT_571 [Rhizomucor pusillus]|uniref:uncharacterized protein n=1 Tax=Rhizomucor pusillus TaxID=4840 RepID=UPI003743BD2D